MDETRIPPPSWQSESPAADLTPEDWRQVRELFDGASQLAQGDRQAWLETACPDRQPIRAEVESLLRFAPAWPVAPNDGLPARMRKGTLLGRGGFSDVFAVEDDEWGSVAVKHLRIVNAAALLQFKREFRLVKERLPGCPHIARVHELLEHGNEWLLLMERLEGETLLERLHRSPAGLEPGTLNQILAQINEGLNALHAVGVLHRDLKPGNVWIKHSGQVVLLDFGLAAMANTGDFDPGVRLFGTIGYVAPERFDRRPDSTATDWYSVGVMLWQMLGGHLPASGVLIEPLRFPPSTPAPLAALCAALLRPDPEQRAGSAEVSAYLTAPRFLAGPPRLPGSRRPRLIGREREFQRLQECFRKISQGHPVCVFLTGESGIGKTELAEAFLSSMTPAALSLRGRCYEASTVPFQACDALVDEIATLLRRIPEEEREAQLPPNMSVLERVFPVLAGLRRETGP